MKISTGLKIASSNKTLSSKLLLYKFIVTLLGSIAIYFFASIIVKPILTSTQLQDVIDLVRRLVGYYFVGPSEIIDINGALTVAFENLANYIIGMKGNIIPAVIFIFVIIELMGFLFAVCDYVISVNINEHMSSMRHAEFFTTLFENFKKACQYALCKTLLVLVYNVVVILLSMMVALLLIRAMGIYSFTIILALVFISIAVRLSFVGNVLPKMICEDKSPLKAFFECFKELTFVTFIERFVSYFVLVLAIYAVVVLTAIVTYSVAFIVTIPFASVSLISVKFVDYYTLNRKKYYVTFDEIVVPKELRQNDENLLNKVDI